MGIARGWEKRVIRTNITYAKRTVRIFSVSPQSRSLFSASFQTFCLTARAYLNTQKYGLFCSLIELCRPGVFDSWQGYPCRTGQRIETRLSVVLWSSRLGVGLTADNPLSSNLEANGRKGISRSMMAIVGGSEDLCG